MAQVTGFTQSIGDRATKLGEDLQKNITDLANFEVRLTEQAQ